VTNGIQLVVRSWGVIIALRPACVAHLHGTENLVLIQAVRAQGQALTIVWKGHLTFGLVSIPVKLLRAARRERVRLHYVHRPSPQEHDVGATFDEPAEPAEIPPSRKGSVPAVEPEIEPPSSAPVTRVRQALVTSSDQQPISRSEVLRGFEVEPDRYVVLDRDELRSLQRRTSPNIEIVRSVKLSEIDPVFFETSYLAALIFSFSSVYCGRKCVGAPSRLRTLKAGVIAWTSRRRAASTPLICSWCVDHGVRSASESAFGGRRNREGAPTTRRTGFRQIAV
jgi:Ku70/Ku80 beta-barrel domain